MDENDRKSPSDPVAHAQGGAAAPRHDAASRGHATTPSTDPKFVRESNTMRRMQPWQIVVLVIATVVVAALVLLYI